jgi:DNA-binding transcriptional ArsR family regulator
MRPLMHPKVDDMTVAGILYALSDPVRVRIFTGVLAAECAQSCTLIANLNSVPMPKSTLSQHFKVLREAGLIRSERKGVELQNKSRRDEYHRRFGPMIDAILEAYAREIVAAEETRSSRRRA